MLLRVQARIVNIGEVLLRTPYVRTRVQHFCPLPAHIAADIDASPTPADREREYPWPVIGDAEWKYDAEDTEVEPGESEQFGYGARDVRARRGHDGSQPHLNADTLYLGAGLRLACRPDRPDRPSANSHRTRLERHVREQQLVVLSVADRGTPRADRKHSERHLA